MKTKETSRKVYDNGFKRYYYKCQNCQSEDVKQINDGSFSPPDLICSCCEKTVTNNPITVVESTRKRALAWFNGLASDGLRAGYAEKHIKQGFRYKSLTGREIEEIWRKEVGDLKLHKGEVVDESYPKEFQDAYLKPNQKQFKEFSKELFKSYIDKFSQENKALMLQILIDDLGVRELVDISVRSSEKV